MEFEHCFFFKTLFYYYFTITIFASGARGARNVRRLIANSSLMLIEFIKSLFDISFTAINIIINNNKICFKG